MRITKIEDLRIGQKVYFGDGFVGKLIAIFSSGHFSVEENPLENYDINYSKIYSEPPNKKVKRNYCFYSYKDESKEGGRVFSEIMPNKIILASYMRNYYDYQEHEIEILCEE